MTDHTKGKGDVQQVILCAIDATKRGTDFKSQCQTRSTPPSDREVSIGSAFLDTLHGPKSWYATIQLGGREIVFKNEWYL